MPILMIGCNISSETKPLDEKYGDPSLIAAEAYAQHYGVSVDEALHRFEVQYSISGLEPALTSNESETFGGLWIQNEPEYRIIVAFTRDGQVTLSKYQQYIAAEAAPYIEVRTVAISYAELLEGQKNLVSALRSLDIASDSSVDITGNRVTVEIAEKSRDSFENAVQSGELIIPDTVQVNFVEGLAQPE